MSLHRIAAPAAVAFLLPWGLAPSSASAASGGWPMFGQNVQNTAAADEGPLNVARLAPKWTFATGGDVSARAAVVKGVAYFPDWGGNLWAVDTRHGAKVWGHQLSDYFAGSPAGSVHSRTSPAVVDGVVYVGTQEGAWQLAIDAATGALRWKTQLRSPAVDPYAIITTSPTVQGRVLYTGVASLQEGVFGDPNFHYDARGSVVAMNVADGSVKWETFTVPPGWSGGGVWGGNLVVDTKRGQLYASTGDNYAVPTDPAYLACIAGGGTKASCASPDNHVDSVLALDLSTGALRWAYKAVTWHQDYLSDGGGFPALDGSDDWNVSCIFGFAPGTGGCPEGAGPDYDFASAPNLVTYRTARGGTRTLVGVGQKSGIYYALDPDTGALAWQTQVGPGSTLGGMEWGSASDGERIYVAITNLNALPTPVGSAGFWAALDPATGAILWRTADPSGSLDLGPLTVAHGVVFAPSMAGLSPTQPTMLALDGSTGKVLWQYPAGYSVVAGASVVDGVVYWGSGYAHLGFPGFTGTSPPSYIGPSTPGTFFAFSRNGK